MLVKDCMTRHPVIVPITMPVIEAQQVMADNKIRHLPVGGDGKRLLGLVTRQRLSLKTDTLGSLNLWDITRHLSDMTVKNVMLPKTKVQTITPDRTIERAARIMADNKIGCLPIIEDGNVVTGIITQIDILNAFQEMLGLPVEGVRVTMRMPNRPGEFSKLMSVLGDQNWGVMGIGTYPSPKTEDFYDAVLKIRLVSAARVEDILNQIPDQTVIDIRNVA